MEFKIGDVIKFMKNDDIIHEFELKDEKAAAMVTLAIASMEPKED